MYALIPNKDTLVFLAKVQKKILESYNSRFAPVSLAVPQFPLWAFFSSVHFLPSCEEQKFCAAGSQLSLGKYRSCILSFPCLEQAEFFFPVELSCFFRGDVKSAQLKIIFGTVRNEAQADMSVLADESVKSLFPRSERVFRTGEAAVENNGWQLFSSVWHRV